MVRDNPANPRIRTKICNLDDAIDAAFFEIIMRLKTGAISVDQFQTETLAFFLNQIEIGKLTAAAQKTGPEQQSEWLVKRHIDQCRYSILCYYVKQGEVHPPHHHHNVASTQILLSGKLHLREYERVGRTTNGKLELKLVTDRILSSGEHFQASEWHRNVHWFSAVDGPAVIFNTNSRGFENSLFDKEEDHFGRLYIDPTKYDENGIITAEEFDEARAEKLFQGKSLSSFPVPQTTYSA